MLDRAALEDYIKSLEALAAEAKQRGDTYAPGYPPGYWYGVKFGFETAVVMLRELLEGNGN